MNLRGRVEPAYEAVQRPTRAVSGATEPYVTKRKYRAVFLPGCVAEGVVVEAPGVMGPDVLFDMEAVVEPPRILEEGTKKWFELVEMGEDKKGKNRTQLLDGILHLLRSIRRLNLVGLLAQGEAQLIAAGAIFLLTFTFIQGASWRTPHTNGPPNASQRPRA